jgi:hypothetical protein
MPDPLNERRWEAVRALGEGHLTPLQIHERTEIPIGGVTVELRVLETRHPPP